MKKTPDEFIAQIKKINPDIEILEKYKNAKIKIDIKCLKKGCNYIWKARPDHLLSGHGCPKCAGNMLKTHEQFIGQLKEINPNIEVLEKYKNDGTKLKVRCLKDGYIWETTPSGLLQRKGCPKCAGNMLKTHKQFITQLKSINPNIEVLEKYKNNRTKIKYKCLIDEYIWEAEPRSLLNGEGCPECGKLLSAEKRTKTHKQFIDELKNINPNIDVLEKYKKGYIKIKVKCLKDDCNYVWEAIPDYLLRGHGCPKCGGTMLKTHKQFIEAVRKINPNIKILEEYKNAKSKINAKCLKCNLTWKAIADSFIKGHGCPECSRVAATIKRTKLTEQFIKDLKIVNHNIEVLGEYKSAKTKIEVKCIKDGCNNVWKATPNSLLRGTGCPKCNESHGERFINICLSSLNLKFKSQYKISKCKNVYPLPFDFAVFDDNNNLLCLIEYDGIQHFKPIDRFGGEESLKQQKINDSIKTSYCLNNNIHLLRFTYENTNREIVSKINNFFNQTIDKKKNVTSLQKTP